jgi:hypothetical protein
MGLPTRGCYHLSGIEFAEEPGMWTKALAYGLLAGLITSAALTISLVLTGTQHTAGTEWLGYLIMILALTLIFFGVKRYRDRDLGGTIRFAPAFGLGLLIAIVAALAYMLAWEVYLVFTGDTFITGYAEGIIAQREAEGLSGDALQDEIASMNQMREQYANPLFRLPITFLEIFPVGLIVSLVSAALLRNPRFANARN